MNNNKKDLLKNFGLDRGIGNISKKREEWQGRRGLNNKRGEEKVEVRVVSVKETMGEIIVTDYVVKKVESLVKLLWYNICFFIKIIL